MQVIIQKHRIHPVWKFYSEKKAYLGQILGETKKDMPTLAEKISDLLLEKKDVDYSQILHSDKSLDIYNLKTNKRVGSFEKEFTLIAKTIQNNLK